MFKPEFPPVIPSESLILYDFEQLLIFVNVASAVLKKIISLNIYVAKTT